MFVKRQKEHCYQQGAEGGVEMEGKLILSASPPLLSPMKWVTGHPI